MSIRRIFAYLVALVILLMPFYRLLMDMNVMAIVMALMLVKMVTDWSIELTYAIYNAQNPKNSQKS